MTITISGAPGTGTTTVSQLLQKKLGIPYVYAGKIFREEAKRYGMSLDEFGKYCEKNPEVDKRLDEYQRDLLKKGNLILEGRISGWIAYLNNIPALKILLIADKDTRAERIVKREGGSKEEKIHEIEEREKSEATRYRRYYNININDTSIYDLVIDTTHKTPEEIVSIIVDNIEEG
ncbi:MAG TPA: cytidylate kinase [Thermoplasmatales archaeon]|nr:cytidylate kinase [Thermoplasmatales archaeon]